MSRRKKETLTLDAFSNPMFRLGFGTQAPLEATEYPLTRLTDDYAKLNSMYRTSAILQAIIDIIPQDMLREWFTLAGEITPEEQEDLDRVVLKTQLKSKIDEGLRWGRLYGGAVGLIMIKGQENDLGKPLDIDSIMPDAFSGLWILDRWSGVFPGAELVMDLSDPDFGLPEYYEIRASEAGKVVARVHHSRIIRFTGRELPYLEKLAEMYWGESEVEPIYEDIALYDSVMANMGNLTFQANVDTLAIKNLEQLFAVGSIEQQKRFWNMMQAQSVAKSNFGTRLIDQETQLHTQQYSFAGFNYVVEAVQTNLSAKTHIPLTKLFGRSPGGLNSTGDSDMQNYYDIVDGLRESRLRPVLERLLPVICMSAWGEVKEDLMINFPPLWTPTATELAQIAGAKASTIMQAFQSGLLNMGPAQAELKKLADETGMFDTIEDDLIEKNKDTTFQDTQQMADPLAGLFGSGDKIPADEEKTRQKRLQSPTEASDAFDPDQPRDDDGKWTSGGGSGHKAAQLEIIQKHNPMRDDYHTGVRSESDIKTAEEAFDESDDENFVYPDFTPAMAKKALKTGKITVYSSKKIGQGGFVSPSKMCAADYAGSGEVHSATVNISDIAWINSDEGQYAKVQTTDGGPGSGNFNHAGRPGKVGGSAPGKGTTGAHGKPREYGTADFSDAIAEIRSGAPNSLSEWINEDGNVKPERLKVHKQIIDDILKDKKASENPTMTMLGGGPASGKSSVMKTNKNDPDYFVIDPDDIKTRLPGYEELAMKYDKAAGFYHEESSAIAKQLSKVGYSEGINAVYDGTGDGSVKSVMRKIRDAREKGYTVNAKYITIGIDDAITRNENRYKNGVRDYLAGKTKIPPRRPDPVFVRDNHIKVSRIAPEVAKEFDSFELWANDRGYGTPKKIATGGNGRGITPVKGEKKAVQDFFDKGKEKLSYE